jgi:hypothetical protein
MKILKSNWLTAALASALCVVLMIVIAMLSAEPSSDTFLRRPSTYFTDPSGARAAYLVLERVLPSVDQWRLPLTELKPPNRHGVATLIAMGPDTAGQGESNALDLWIASGGQLILAANADWTIQRSANEKSVKNFLDRHGIEPDAVARRGVKGAIIKPVGLGRIVYVPDRSAFSNENLRTSDNAVWLVERCTEWGGGALFDEYHLGFGRQRGFTELISMFAVTPWGLVFLQLALAGAVYTFGCKRRFGRPLAELPVERTNPLESVQAVAGLFATARARGLCAKTIYQYLKTYVPPRDLGTYAETAKTALSARELSDAELIRFAQNATEIARSSNHGSGGNKRSAAAS